MGVDGSQDDGEDDDGLDETANAARPPLPLGTG